MCYKCKYCGKEFETGVKLGGHVSKCKLNPNKNQEKIHQIIKENFEKRNPIEEHKLKCQVCGNEYILQIRHNQFEQGKYKKTCCSKCAHQLTNLHSNIENRNQKISKSMIGKIPVNRNKNFSYYKECKYCGNIFDIRIRNSKSDFCCDTCRDKSRSEKSSNIAKKSNFGGYHPNSIKNHHHGNYNGIHCDSSWELAYLVWCLEHNIPIKRCEEVRYYKLNKNLRKYYPDFVINNNEIIEIKGLYDEVAKIKSEQNPDIKVLLYDDLKESLEYTISKYGKKFWEILYNK